MAMVDWLLLPIGLLALAYALKRLLPASLWARLAGRSPAASRSCSNPPISGTGRRVRLHGSRWPIHSCR